MKPTDKHAEPTITIEMLAAIDLDSLRAEIATKEAALDAIVAEHRKAIDGRIALLKVVDVMQNGKKPRAPRGSKKPKGPKPFSDIDQVPQDRADRLGGMPEVTPSPPRKGPRPDREKIADLLRSQGAVQAHQIAGRLAIAEARASLLLNSDSMFEMNPSNGRWSVTA
jgi:hypothetical protein